MQASSAGDVVKAATVQRTNPAPAASAIDLPGPIRCTSRGPISRNITTSESTDSDHSALTVKKSMPALRQRITEKVSCSAWLPHSSAATTTSPATAVFDPKQTSPALIHLLRQALLE